jgi:hypothetical protein
MCIRKHLLFGIIVTVYLIDFARASDGIIGKKLFSPSMDKQRASNVLYQSVHLQKVSATRFLPLFNITGVGSWFSPRTTITLDGIPFRGYPFGIHSIDLVPVDLVTVDTLAARTIIGTLHSGPSPGGSIDIAIRPIPDSLALDIRLFTGSETGDPLVHLFTRPERSYPNKNKVGPSFALSISNKLNNWTYRISGGGFFYFSTGSVNDFTIGRYHSELIRRQNRQIKAIGEAEYTIDGHRSLVLYTAGINLFGWEMSPFTSLFNHYTSVGGTGRITYRDTASGFVIALVRDEGLTRTEHIYGTLPGELRITEWSLYPSYETKLMGKLDVAIFSNLGTFKAVDRSGEGTANQAFLQRDVSALEWGAGIEFGYSYGQVFTSGGFRIDSKLNYAPEAAGDLMLQYRSSRFGTFYTSFGTSAYFPTYLERYGYFKTVRAADTSEVLPEFVISGNRELRTERVYEIKKGYVYSNRNLTITTDVFGRYLKNRVNQHTSRSYRPVETGEILRTATYRNDDGGLIPGLTFRLDAGIFPFLLISTGHHYVDNSNMSSIPRYKSSTTFGLLLPLGVESEITLTHTGKTFWREFILAPQDDALLQTGFGGEIPSATVTDVTVSRRFERFYFANGLEISAQMQNIFNVPFQRIPVGNYIERAVFVYVFFGL